MTDLKISQLTDGSTPQDTDLFPIARSGENYGLSWSEMAAAIPAGGGDTLHTVASSGSSLTVDFSTADVWDITLTANCTLTLTGATTGNPDTLTLILRQDSSGGRTVTWPTVTWLSGAAPVIHAAIGAIDVITLFSDDGGTTWLGAQAVAPYPTGYEINYTEITAPISISATSEASGTTILSPGALTFDGSPVLLEFFTVFRMSTVATTHVISLFEGATQVTELTAILLASAAQDVFPINAKYRFTPSAGSHTYTVTAYTNNSGGTQARCNAGSGGTAGNPPTFVRFTKV